MGLRRRKLEWDMEVDIRKNQLKRRKKFELIFGLFQTNSPDPMIEIFSVGFPDFVPNFWNREYLTNKTILKVGMFRFRSLYNIPQLFSQHSYHW